MNATDRTAWIAKRRKGIGGSDIAPMLGLSPYRSPYELWLDKTGRETATPDPMAAERMHFGNRFEALVAQEYAERTGRTVQRITKSLRHPRCAIALANIDRAIVAPGSRARWDDKTGRVLGATGILECKTAHALAVRGDEWGDAGTDQVPEAYWLQCQWYMGVASLSEADLAVLFGGQHFRVYTLAADAALFDDLLNAAGDWWQRYVIADTPPPVDTEADTRRRWPASRSGAQRIVGPDIAQACADMARLKANAEEIEAEVQKRRDLICAAFKDAESITHAGRTLATWKHNKPSAKTDWKGLAHFLHPVMPAGVFEQFTATTPGARVLRLQLPKES